MAVPDNCDYHDILFLGGVFVFVAEAEIFITTQTSELSLYPSKKSDFLRCRLLIENDTIFLVTLELSYDATERNVLTKYELSAE